MPELPTFEIPHATEVWGEGVTLHVATDLMHDSGSPGFDRKNHDEMMGAIAVSTYAMVDTTYVRDHFVNYVIHAPDQP